MSVETIIPMYGPIKRIKFQKIWDLPLLIQTTVIEIITCFPNVVFFLLRNVAYTLGSFISFK